MKISQPLQHIVDRDTPAHRPESVIRDENDIQILLPAQHADEVVNAIIHLAEQFADSISAVPEPEGAVQVEAIDLRFGLPGQGRFTALAVVQGARVMESRFQFTPPGQLPKPR